MIDPFHPYGRVKRLREKPLERFEGSEQFLCIKAGILFLLSVTPWHRCFLHPVFSLCLLHLGGALSQLAVESCKGDTPSKQPQGYQQDGLTSNPHLSIPCSPSLLAALLPPSISFFFSHFFSTASF